MIVDLFMTIEEALGKATYPERLVFGIAFQVERISLVY